jgi:cytochrome c
MAVKADAALEPVEGMHDVYFVFRNPAAKPGQILVQIVEIAFQDQRAPAKK